MKRARKANDLAALADHLAARQEAILTTWRRVVESDPELSSASTLSRAQFNDHVPAILAAFERRLRARYRDEAGEAAEEHKQHAAEHGGHRWHSGYNQEQAVREWGHLHLCLLNELENYVPREPSLGPNVMADARRALAELCSEGVTESAASYSRLQQVEAAGRVRDLQEALEQVRETERRRAEMWREAAHDLRGKVGVVNNVAEILNNERVPEPARAEYLTMLQESMTSVVVLLNELMTLSRLEAGQEQRKVEDFDAAVLLRELCASFEPLARARNLFLKSEGTGTLLVQGDAVKVQRIAQNLLLNAIKYTERGGVKVNWERPRTGGAQRWLLCVQDTGPGFQSGSVDPLAQALKEVTEEARTVDQQSKSIEAKPIPTLPSQSAHRPPNQKAGEGIGLSIVKRLCELLDASLELETEPGKGSTFRVIFPCRYDA
jgi:signal transduction histidine kinase